jgi:hypothetical protein
VCSSFYFRKRRCQRSGAGLFHTDIDPDWSVFEPDVDAQLKLIVEVLSDQPSSSVDVMNSASEIECPPEPSSLGSIMSVLISAR